MNEHDDAEPAPRLVMLRLSVQPGARGNIVRSAIEESGSEPRLARIAGELVLLCDMIADLFKGAGMAEGEARVEVFASSVPDNQPIIRIGWLLPGEVPAVPDAGTPDEELS